MNKYIIIPNCSDLNRGDQALVWETKRIAEDAGYRGKYYVTVEDNEPVKQSVKHGLVPISLLLKHPSRFFRKNDNIIYSLSIKFKWGLIAIYDLFISLLMLCPVTRWIVFPFLDRNRKETIKLFKEADAIFIKGGGFIHFYGGLTSLYYAYFSLYHIFFASIYKKKIFILPNSIGPYEGPLIKWIVKKAFGKCTLVTVRETYSQKMAKMELGFNFPFFPDLALYLSNSNLTKENISQQYNITFDRKLVAITMRPHRFPKSSTPKEDYLKFKQEMAKFIEYLFHAGYMPLLIDHTLAINTNENDAICIKEVIDLVTPKHYIYFSDTNLNCQQLKSIYSVCDYIVGTRFHSVIFSFANHVPGIAITYTGNKAEGIMNDFGLGTLAININDVTCEKLKERFNYVKNNEREVRLKIANYLEFADKARKDLINKLKEV